MTPEEFVRRGQAAQRAVDAVITDQLTIALRALLRARPEQGQVLASALAYELAAVIAKHAPTQRAANTIIDTFALVMKDQIERLGVGVDHP
jgi:uncharacterized protein YicC (UPF0701 family)